MPFGGLRWITYINDFTSKTTPIFLHLNMECDTSPCATRNMEDNLPGLSREKRAEKSAIKSNWARSHSLGRVPFANFYDGMTADEIEWAIGVYLRLVCGWIMSQVDYEPMLRDTLRAISGFGEWAPSQYRIEFEYADPAAEVEWDDPGGFYYLNDVAIFCRQTFRLAQAQYKSLKLNQEFTMTSKQRLDVISNFVNDKRMISRILDNEFFFQPTID